MSDQSAQIAVWITNAGDGPDARQLNVLGYQRWELMSLSWNLALERLRFLATLRRSWHQWCYWTAWTAVLPGVWGDPDPTALGWQLASKDPDATLQGGIPGYLAVYKRVCRYDDARATGP